MRQDYNDRRGPDQPAQLAMVALVDYVGTFYSDYINVVDYFNSTIKT